MALMNSRIIYYKMLEYFQKRPTDLFTGEEVVRIMTRKTHGLNLSVLNLPDREWAIRLINAAEESMGIPMSEVATKSRKRHLVIVRHICMWYMAERMRLGLKMIGDIWDVDHSTVIHARDNVNHWMLMYKARKHEVSALLRVMRAVDNDDFVLPFNLKKIYDFTASMAGE